MSFVYVQLFWTPDLPDLSAQAPGTDAQQMNSREKCAFCEDDVPPNHMYSHLNSHFKNKAGDWHTRARGRRRTETAFIQGFVE